MPEDSPVAVPFESDATRSNDGESNRTRRNRNNNRRAPIQQSSRFEGKCAALKKHIYDVSQISNNYELFNTTTEAIGEYVATEYDYAG